MEIFSEEENEKRLKTNVHKLIWTSQTSYLNVEVIERHSVSPEKIHRIFWKETDAEKALHFMGGRPLGDLKKQEIMIIFLCTLSILSSYLTACRFSIIYFCMSLRFSSSQQTCISISCSCRSISFVADPSILCSSIREKCSMLLIDSFSCRVRITSFQTEEHHCYSCSTPPTRDSDVELWKL